MIWHILDVRAVWIKEFTAALSAQADTLGWCPQITGTGMFRDSESEIKLSDPELRVRYFPLQRGFAKFPINVIAREAERVSRRILKRTEWPADSVLVCTSPHYAPVAKRWPGLVVYYVTDLFIAYGDNPAFVTALDRRICKAADLVCPNSDRIADYLVQSAGCDPEKLSIIPNATRRVNILPAPSFHSTVEKPADVRDLARPFAGVLGNLAANMDWLILEEVVARTPWLSWVFVGPTEWDISDTHQRDARHRLKQLGGRIRFVGAKVYAQLQDYARAVDVAVLPYRKSEPTYSGSSTRFYEHLAAGRPIIATRGFAELLKKEPLLRLVDSAEEMTLALEELRAADFRDGQETLRWSTSQTETWEERAAMMRNALNRQIARDREAA
jgi:glycosyltransferase involved in cell wall biosynthesis